MSIGITEKEKKMYMRKGSQSTWARQKRATGDVVLDRCKKEKPDPPRQGENQLLKIQK